MYYDLELTMKMRHCASIAIFLSMGLWGHPAPAQSRPSAPITVTVNTARHIHAIPSDFIGLGFETASELPNHYGVSGYFFTPSNKQLITLFQNIGVKEIRVGGGTVDTSGPRGHAPGGHCGMPPPTTKDIDNLFQFAQAAGIKVLYSVRLLNPTACSDPHLASNDAHAAAYIWSKYRANLDYFAIGNEPDVRTFHSYPGHLLDPKIYEAVPGVAGSAYPSYLTAWRHVANAILKSVPQARFAGPDTAVSGTSSYTPNPATGMSWTQKFIEDEKPAGIVLEATQHHYVWGRPGNTSARVAIDDMLSPAWDNNTSRGTQPARNGKTAHFNPYPFVYEHILAPVAARGVPYRMTEANDCLHGVEGASNGYAAALWALDYMHWWAAHGMAGVNFHNNPWIPTDTIIPRPNPCPPSGCGDYTISPKGYGMKAFDLGGHGYAEPVTVSNRDRVNLTAYAIGAARDSYITIINKTHNSTNDSTDAVVTIRTKGFGAASAASVLLTDGDPGNARMMTAAIGGAAIPNDGRWLGKWTPLSPDIDGEIKVRVPATTAVVVHIHAAGNDAGPVQMNQNGELEIFGIDSYGRMRRNQQRITAASGSGPDNWGGWTLLTGEVRSRGTVAVAKNLDNTLEIFVPSQTGDVYYKHQLIPNGAWGGWVDMGGSSRNITDLQAVNNADGSLSVFGIGPDGNIWYASQSAPGTGWPAWMDMGGEQIQPGFVVGQDLDGRVDVFGADHSGNVWYNRQTSDGGWNGWRELSGETVQPRLAIARDLNGRIYLWGIGKTDEDIWEISQKTPGGHWGNWSDLRGKGLKGARIKSGFAVGQNSDGRFEIVGTGSDSHVWHSWNLKPGTWSSWRRLGRGVFRPYITITNTADGRIQVFAIGRDKDVWSNWQTTPDGSWHGWADFGGKGIQFHAMP